MRREIRRNFLLATFATVITCSHTACSQRINSSGNNAPPVVLTNAKAYLQSISSDSAKQMVLLEKYVSHVFTDLKYATKNNFTGVILYHNPQVFVRLPVAQALKNVEDELKQKDLSLVFYDAYRPYSITTKMWKLTKDRRYVAEPKRGSMHNRGLAVDVGLVKASTGEKLPMPTEFDDFSEKAHHSYMQLSKAAIENRALLKTVMEKHGFRALSTEWWHYAYGKEAKRYELLDISFADLGRLSD